MRYTVGYETFYYEYNAYLLPTFLYDYLINSRISAMLMSKFVQRVFCGDNPLKLSTAHRIHLLNHPIYAYDGRHWQGRSLRFDWTPWSISVGSSVWITPDTIGQAHRHPPFWEAGS